MTLANVINDIRALHGESGVRELLYGHLYEDNDLIHFSSILVDDLNDAYREETVLT
jgi:hypothetical protein